MDRVSNSYWPRLWAENPGLLREARRQDYLVLVTNSGELACKACGIYLPWEDPTKHFQRHQRELDQYLARKKREAREPEAEGFYPKPCESCNKPIPRTGKPGRPPRLCTACEYPFAELSEEDLLTEMGLG